MGLGDTHLVNDERRREGGVTIAEVEGYRFAVVRLGRAAVGTVNVYILESVRCSALVDYTSLYMAWIHPGFKSYEAFIPVKSPVMSCSHEQAVAELIDEDVALINSSIEHCLTTRQRYHGQPIHIQ